MKGTTRTLFGRPYTRLSNRIPPPSLKHFYNIQQQNNNHTQTDCEFHQTPDITPRPVKRTRNWDSPHKVRTIKQPVANKLVSVADEKSKEQEAILPYEVLYFNAHILTQENESMDFKKLMAEDQLGIVAMAEMYTIAFSVYYFVRSMCE